VIVAYAQSVRENAINNPRRLRAQTKPPAFVSMLLPAARRFFAEVRKT
jgi:hypothetical protein